jgi:transcription initiation factor TFIIIB Brf1 subunit/transcription initiation factor TFIIB
MTCEPYCDECGGNLGHPANGDWTCAKCKIVELRKCRKERIRKDEFDPANENHFRLQSRGGAWRYYRRVDPLIYIGDGMYRAKSLCTPADIEHAKRLNSAANAGLI